MIPLVDLKAQYASIRDEISAAVDSVLESGQFVLGPEVQGFEAEFGGHCQTRHCIGVNTGTSALHLALLAAGVGPGDEVITTPFTFIATAAAIKYVGAEPVFVDIDPRTYNLDPTRVEVAITSRTRAIIPVHLYGQPAEMDRILDLARAHNLTVIEDACQAHGAEYQGKRAGSIGTIGCFSFYPGKNLGAYGEGGAIVTNDPDLAEKMALLRDWGAPKKYVHEMLGFNYRLDEMQAAILRVKLAHLDRWTEQRRAAARRYGLLLAETPEVEAPWEDPMARHVYHIYAVRLPEGCDREQVQARLAADGVSTGIHYPIPVHLQPAFSDLGLSPGSFPHAEDAARRVLSLPIFPELTPEQQQHVVNSLVAAVNAVGQRANATLG